MTDDRVREILLFVVVGAMTFVVDYGLLYIFTTWAEWHYLYSNAIAFTAAVLFNYWLCVVLVFKDAKQQTKKRATIFIGSSIVGLFLNQICMWFLVDILSIYYLIAKIFATIIVMLCNYVMKRKAVVG